MTIAAFIPYLVVPAIPGTAREGRPSGEGTTPGRAAERLPLGPAFAGVTNKTI